MSDLNTRIKNQVEFYFGDSNFRRDRFLRSQAEEDPDGFVPIEVIAAFTRMKELGATSENVADAVANSEIVKLSEDKKRIARANPLPEVDDSNERTIFMKPFPKDVTIDAVREWGSKEIAPVSRVVLKRNPERELTGEVLVEFHTKAGAETALAKKDNLSFAGKAIEKVMTREGWLEDRNLKVKAKKAERDAKKAKDHEEAEKKAMDEAMQQFDRSMKESVVVKLSGASEECNERALKFALKRVAGIRFVGYSESDETDDALYVRCEEPADALKVKDYINDLKAKFDKLHGDNAATDGLKEQLSPAEKEVVQTLGGSVPSAVILQGEEEKKYWKEALDNMQEAVRNRVLTKMHRQKMRGRREKRKTDEISGSAEDGDSKKTRTA